MAEIKNVTTAEVDQAVHDFLTNFYHEPDIMIMHPMDSSNLWRSITETMGHVTLDKSCMVYKGIRILQCSDIEVGTFEICMSRKAMSKMLGK